MSRRTHRSPMSRTLGALAAVALLAGGLAACSGSDSEGSGDAGSTGASGKGAGSTPSSSESPYLEVPDGVELTPPGTHLEVGDRGVVAWEPDQKTIGALDIKVTSLERTTTKAAFGAWQLSDQQKASTPYFVRAKVRNVGDSNLGGQRVPLYVVNDQNVLLESTPFASSFKPCPSTALPDKFKPGTKTSVCLVYLAPDHGSLEAVSFRPVETFDPIIWTGEVTKYQPEPEKKPEKKSEKKSKKG